jgi:DNA mismatch repair protein MutS2
VRPRDLLALEFPRVAARIADFAASSAGQARCRTLTPTADRTAAESALERADQLFRLLEVRGDPPLSAFADARADLRSAAHEGFALDGKALVAVRATLAAIRAAGGFFRRGAEDAPALASLAARLIAFPGLEGALTRALDEDGTVLDAASEALAEVRSSIRRLRAALTRKLEELVARQGMAELLADTYVTLRNSRFVIPVRAAAATRLPGVVQDRSVSGETLFLEPLFAVELNNQLLLAMREEERIVQRILTDLTALVGAEHAAISDAVESLIEADCLVAAARFARAYGCTRPTFSDLAIDLRRARHPGLLFTGRAVTPVDLLLPAGRSALVITGPNTGGKTVALKTLGLCAVMAQSGLLIPAAEGARLPCFSAIYADVGDEQNIERNLSTFSAHVANLCEIAAAGVSEALVLLDEPGVGTDPEDGAALALGLLRWLASQGAHVAVTTHYTPVKLVALDDPQCVVAAVEADVETLQPRYRLLYDSIGRSLALPIARRLGLPEAVLSEATAAQSDHTRALNAALERIERRRVELEQQLGEATVRAAALAASSAEVEQLQRTLRERRRDAWQETLREARAFLRQLKADGQAQLAGLRDLTEARAAFARFTREQEAAIAARDPASAPAASAAVESGVGRVQVGDMVAVGDRGIQGELLAVDGPRAWIQRGALRFEVPAGQLRRVSGAARAQPSPVVAPPDDGADAAAEISLIGLRAADALTRLEPFLDRAVRDGAESVRIVHGVGSGALRRAVREYLAASPYCADFRPGESGEGGAGVTVATLRG